MCRSTYFIVDIGAEGKIADLLDLINDSLGIAGWLILLSVIVVIGDIAFVVMNIKSTLNPIFGVTVSSPIS